MLMWRSGSKALKCVLSVVVVMVLSHAVSAENWPQWRGPSFSGVSTEKNVPTTWSKNENVAWRTVLPGAGGATPVVWGDHIFGTSVTEEGDLVLVCVGADGKPMWQKKVGSGDKKVRGDEGNMASPSPCTDGEHVWAMMGTGDIACFDFAGTEVWKDKLQNRYGKDGKFSIQFGMSSSPVLYDGRLYLQLIHGEGNPTTREAVVVCLDAATGKEVWKVDRPSDGTDENEHSYASAILYKSDKTTFLITHGADYTVAHNLRDGSELWRVGGLLNPKTKYDRTLRFVASPAIAPGLIVIPTAKGGPVVAISPDSKGMVTDKESGVLWTRPKTPDVPSPLIHDGLVYLCMENGVIQCADAKTGEEIYQKRAVSDRYRASPVYADGHVYVAARKGIVTVFKAGREFEQVATNDVGEALSASLAISNGRIYLRTFDALWAIGSK
ncbi:MAG: PQQ-binding-like beta-propeller repeat protein [Planctomycetaceae bacterium]|nr:PQQ-binding-like beta-propeller repeat protein [Planctomycetaceae bacterium]